MAKLIILTGSRPANPGESLVVSYLKENLPDTFILIPNAEIIQRGSPAYEYDVIVIGPHAVYVVEVKRWLGGIQGDDYKWLIGGQHRRQNPWITVNNKARVLKSKIEQRLPSLKSLWVEAVVAIADAQSRIELNGECRTHVFRYPDLPTYLMDVQALGGRAGNLKLMLSSIEQAILEAVHGRTQGPLQFGCYKVLETLSLREQVSEYLARNILLPDSPPTRLRVFSYNPYLPENELIQHQARIRRETESLQKIGHHPNIIPLRNFEAVPEDPNLIMETTDWSESGTVRDLINKDSPLSIERKLDMAIGIVSGLKAAHAVGVIHRDLRPENILIGADDAPRLMNFDHARFEKPGSQTVGPFVLEPGIHRAYLAPELLNPLVPASPTSDLYSLGAILFELLTSSTLYNSPEEVQHSPRGPLEFIGDIPSDLNDLVIRLLQPDPAQRPQNAGAVLDQLIVIREKPSGTLGAETPDKPISVQPDIEVEPAVYDNGSLIDGKYQVQKVLGVPGGAGRVYRVYDEILDRVYALKVYDIPGLGSSFLQQEAGALAKFQHPAIVQVHNWGKLLSGRVYLVTDYVDGEDLNQYTSPEHHLPVRQAVSLILQLMSALAYLHPNVDRIAELREKKEQGEEFTGEEFEEFMALQDQGWLHRDIKPANLMLCIDGNLKLIDFNIAARAKQVRQTFVGTPGYMLPEVGFMPWNTDGDLFATGIVLYELITGQHPYPERTPSIDIQPTDPRKYVSDLDPKLADIILHAVSCDANVRYHSARRFRQDLLDLNEQYLQTIPVIKKSISTIDLSPDERGLSNYNPYVTRLLKQYSQARRDNSGTRGLDDFSRLTYIHTRLDRSLQPAILDGQYRLVIITGNAGDGKTAFIQNLEKEIESHGGIIERVTANSSRFQNHGLSFVTNYDGSQDDGETRANDKVLTEFFASFDDKNIGNIGDAIPIHLIAINEGRLVDFFSPIWANGQANTVLARRFQVMGEYIHQYFERGDNPSDIPSWMVIVDLNKRSVIAPDSEEDNTSIFDRQLQAMLKQEFWQPCEECEIRSRCFIKYNVNTLSDQVSGAAVCERIRTLFEIVHLRRQLHITMRDMRSSLSWMLFRDHTCQDVAHDLEESIPSQKILDLLYCNAFRRDGQPTEGQGEDRLVRLLRQIDPASTSNPSVDRALHFKGLSGIPMMAFDYRSTLADEALLDWRLPAGWQAAQSSDDMVSHGFRHSILRRLAFFERRDRGWISMLPYRYLDRFKEITQVEIQYPDNIMKNIAHGYSFVEGTRNQEISEKFICIRAGQNVKARVRSFRLFPLADFIIEVPRFQEDHYLEHTRDHFVFSHAPLDKSQLLSGAQKASLSISMDLLELLEHINGGYVPSPDDIGGIFINLMTFKNALAHLPYKRVLLTRDDKQYFELNQSEDTKILLQVWRPGGN